MDKPVLAPEQPFEVRCGEDTIRGILHGCNHPKPACVMVNVVGGPQYRVGSHRQFVLAGRAFAANSIPFIRFDVRGMGDASGKVKGFEAIDEDLTAIVDWTRQKFPDSKLVLMGLCDGASAILLSSVLPRIDGMVLVNPWVRTTASGATTQLKHYYMRKLLDLDLWRKLVHFEFDLRGSFADLLKTFRQSRSAKTTAMRSYVVRMRMGLESFQEPVCIVLSGQDLTAREFNDLLSSDSDWRELQAKSVWDRVDFDEADHTFSNRVDLDRLNEYLIDWVYRRYGAAWRSPV
jgi:uncharacterized protein